MTRHEQDRVHEASGIAFTFAGHLVWGNPKLAEGQHGDIEAWRCGCCHGLVVGEPEPHADLHGRFDALVARLDNVSHGAFKPIEAVPGAVLSDSPKGVGADQARLVNDEVREERVAAYREAYEQGRVVWRDAATVREVTE